MVDVLYVIGKINMPDNISIQKRDFTPVDISKIDVRLRRYLNGFQVTEYYKGKVVKIPNTWNSEIYPYKYFEVYKNQGDNNAGEEENEIQLYLSCGWRGYDDEVVIVLMIQGKNVLDRANNHVSAEIYKFGGAGMKVEYNGTLITDFKKQEYWWKKPVDKVWIERMS